MKMKTLEKLWKEGNFDFLVREVCFVQSKLQSLTKYLRHILVFIINNALWKKFNFHFQGVWCYY